MKRMKGMVFGLGVAGMLGFGAVQAVATPAPPQKGALQCDPVCASQCGGFGGTMQWNGICRCCG